jgi:tetrahydromethanopterin S-methyltransferase subunit G
MPKVKPVVARTPEELAGALGLPKIAAKEWQVQHVLLKRLKDITRRQKITHGEIAKRAGTSRTRVTAILNDDLQHVSSEF